MATQLFLIAPPDAGAGPFADTVKRLLLEVEVAALLLTAGNRSEAAYRAFVAAVAPMAQEAGCAALVEATPQLARALAADGLHVSAALAKPAIAALKPDLIVGVGGIMSRHEAMAAGELGADYIMFGPLSGAIDPAARELAGWWAETMEIPSVFSDPEATADNADAMGCEFLALSDSLWRAPDPVALLAQIAARLERGA